MRVHIVGASGSGTTTLGTALAGHLGADHFDTDDFFWKTTSPPYQTVRVIEQRRSLLARDLDAHDSWVLSGSLCGWGDLLVPLFQSVMFLWVPTDTRLARLRERERTRFGSEALPIGAPSTPRKKC